MATQMEAAQRKFGLAAAALDAMSPLRVLERGYAIAHDASGREWTHSELCDSAAAAAVHHGLGERSRVLSTMAFDSLDGLDAGLLAPLAVSGSVVLVTNADPSTLSGRCATEKVTDTAGITVGSLPRLD